MFASYLVGKRLGIRETFRMAKYAFSKDLKNFLMVFVAIYLPINLLLSVINYFIIDVQSGFDFSVILQNPEALQTYIQSAEYGMIGTYNFAIAIVELFFTPLAAMAIARIVKNYAYGKETNFKAVLKETITKGSTLIFATVLFCVFVFLGFTFLIIPGIALMVFFIFYTYCIMLNDDGAFKCLKNSFKMVRKKWFRMLGYIICFYLLDFFITYGITIVLGVFATNIISGTIVSTIAALGEVMYHICLTLIFLNIQAGGFMIKPNKNDEEIEIQ